ncbi:zinc ribbon domain-containing protein [Variovorax sp. J22P168]|uniref:zinc ribbon domain-containing protein n=1 Tax=Variovorax jilinensis TaxID=3053513 RepID=UPI0025776CAE|nr:zinc ribbon domain-containing protein [Variovorax sp. J22P168]MDM0015017.1 zinc ribbon domain-containing protein [Variovorax sp. J22P168]
MPIALAPLLFAFVGPPIGYVFLVAGRHFDPAQLLVLPLSYVFAPVAAIAGLVYVGLGLAYLRASGRSSKLGFLVSCVIGGIAGYVAVEIIFAVWRGMTTEPGSSLSDLRRVGTIAGFICGASMAMLPDFESDAADSTLTLKKLRAASLEADGTMKMAHGRCPSCGSVVAMSSEACPACGATFGDQAAWKVAALSAHEVDECHRILQAPAQPTYADGSSVREGDWVKIERGKVLGRVSEVVCSEKDSEQKNLQGLGVVVDAPPKGFIFLSEEILREDPLRFVRRGPTEHGPTEEVRRYIALGFGIGLFMVLPAIISLISALYQAMTVGEVLVISFGRTSTSREMVPWRHGWARFAGPVVLVISLSAWDGSRGLTTRWWLAGTGVVLGLSLLAFSQWFATAKGALMLACAYGVVAMTFFVDRRFGRIPALGIIVAVVAWGVWAVVA